MYIVWTQFHDIMFRGSSDYGTTYGPIITLASYAINDLVFSPKLLASGSTVHVAWIVAHETNQTIFYRRSLDNGLSWDQIITLSPPGQEALDYQMSISGNNVYLAWSEFSQQGYTDSVIFRISIDQGASFEQRVTLADPTSIGLFTVRLAASNNTIHVFYIFSPYYGQDNFPQGTTYYRRSLDGGAAFEGPRILGMVPDTWVADMQLAVLGNRIFLLEEENELSSSGGRIFSSAGIFLTTSTDSGSTWRPQITIAIANSTIAPSDPQIIVSGNNVYIAWQLGRCGDIVEQGTQCKIFFKRSTNGGLEWTKPVVLSDTGAEMLLAASDNNVYVAWTEQTDMNILHFSFEILFRSSMNKGATFDNSIVLSSLGWNEVVAIGASTNSVYVVWIASATAYIRHGAIT